MVRKSHSILLLVLTAFIMVKPVSADDLLPPPWRWEPRTTFQHWTFDDEDNPALPEIINNPYGSAFADIWVVEPYGAGWGSLLLGREGIWADIEKFILQIDNVPDQSGYKELWIQVTYYTPPSDIPEINVPGGVFLDGTTTMLEPYGPGHWFLRQEVWEIDPNPDYEVVEILAEAPFGCTVDQIVVDTACFAGEPRIIDMTYISSSSVEVTWTSEPTATYRVESSTDELAFDGTMTWEIEQEDIPAGSGTTTSWEDTDVPASGFKFYRVCAEGPGGGLAASAVTGSGTGSAILKRGNLAEGSHTTNNNENGTRVRLGCDGNCGR